jgi:hypothetical protein
MILYMHKRQSLTGSAGIKCPREYRIVNWVAIYCAMRESRRQRRAVITKHSAGMCGVGKCMKLWKKRALEACPWCGLLEDASQVWKGNGSGAKEIWDKAIGVLANCLSEAGTDPDIKLVIISNLR